jgi:DNA polymerase III delta prime subunit
MKLEVMQYRTTHRDYYDIYSLLQEDIRLDTIISRARRYLRYNLKTREIMSLLVNKSDFKEDKKISELLPKYHVSIDDIKLFMVEKIKEMH